MIDSGFFLTCKMGRLEDLCGWKFSCIFVGQISFFSFLFLAVRVPRIFLFYIVETANNKLIDKK